MPVATELTCPQVECVDVHADLAIDCVTELTHVGADPEILDELLSAKCEYFNPLATLIKSGRFKWQRFDQCNLTFRVNGDVAVVMGRLDAKGTGAKWSPQEHTWLPDPNGSFAGALYFTHVYRRERGKWLLAALQNAVPVGPQPATEKCNSEG